MKDETSLKTLFLQIINIATRVTTLIFLFSTTLVYGSEATYSSRDILSIILIGIICGLLMIIFYIPKKAGKKFYLVLQIIYFLCVNVSVIAIGYYCGWLNISDRKNLLIIEAMIIAIYIIVQASFFILDCHEADRMNKLLQKRKQNQSK